MSKANLVALFSILAAILVGPFLAGLLLAGSENIFGGFLLNPLDGNSYLAKMQLGWRGEFRFQPPYSIEAGEGAYLFLFYIFLGRLARFTSLPIPLIFHFARLLSSAFLVYAIFRLYRRWFGDFTSNGIKFLATLTLFGSGLGWIAGLFGGFTSDFWVAEAYPFLSMYANPHFPLGLGLLLVYFDQLAGGLSWRQAPMLTILGLGLAIIQPFAVVVGAVIFAGIILWEFLATRRSSSLPAIGFVLGGGIFLVYQYTAILSDPVLSLWNEQNVTAAPPFWDYLLSFSPALIFAIIQIPHLIKNRQMDRYKLFVIWLVAGIVLLYLPFNLQRRFLLGYFIPSAFLGSLGVMGIARGNSRLHRAIRGIVLAGSLITNLFVVTGGIGAAARHEPLFFFSRDEQAAFEWMRAHSAEAGPILASEETGMYIPAHTGWRVVYGHPFETVNAKQRKAEVEAIFNGSMSAEEIDAYLEKNRILYVFWGPREQENLSDNPFTAYPVAYQDRSVTIYTVRAGQ